MSLEEARINMIKQQLRTRDILEEDILHLLAELPREDFVPKELTALAYADTKLDLGHGQSMLSPFEEAKIIQSLTLSKQDTVLEIGTGLGFLTALLAKQSKFVYSVGHVAEFNEQAAQNLSAKHIDNVKLLNGNAVNGWPEFAPYDVIVMTSGVSCLSKSLQEQLTIGGRLFTIIGEPPVMEACLIVRKQENTFETTKLFETRVPLMNGSQYPKDKFVF